MTRMIVLAKLLRSTITNNHRRNVTLKSNLLIFFEENCMKNILIAFFITILSLQAFSSETVEGFKKDVVTFKQEMTLKLEKIEKEIEALKNKTKEKGESTQTKAIAELESARDKVKTEINDLEKTTESRWTKIKSKIAKSIDTLNTKAQKALKEEKEEKLSH